MIVERFDGAAELSKVSGLSRDTVLSLWDQVKENSRKLNTCSRHRFAVQEVKIGQKVICLECGGEMDLTRVGQYIKGYFDAGGNPDDVWPGFFDRKKT